MRFAILAIWALSIAVVASAVPSRAEAETVRCVLLTPNCGWVALDSGNEPAPLRDARG